MPDEAGYNHDVDEIERAHDEIGALKKWRTNMLVSLISVIGVGALAAGGTWTQVRANSDDLTKTSEQVEKAREKQEEIAKEVVGIKKDVEHIRDEQKEIKDLLKEVNKNTKPKP